MFGSLHSLLALIGSNRIAAAQELITALRQSAARGAGDQAEVASAVGVELAETILAMALSSRDARRQAARPLAALGQRLPRLGGSIAQRDVFLRTLLLIALDAGDDVAAAKLKGLRLRQRKEDRFLALVDRRPSNAKGAPQLQLATA